MTGSDAFYESRIKELQTEVHELRARLQAIERSGAEILAGVTHALMQACVSVSDTIDADEGLEGDQ